MGLNPPESLSDEQVVYWKELVNRVHAAVSATETPDDTPTMEQVEAVAQNIPGADDPHVGFQRLPDGWDRSTVLEVWTKVGGSVTSCKAKFMGEEGWSDRKSDRFCAALKDEVRQSEEWREGGGQQPGLFSMVPGVPNDPDRITRDMLEDIVRWKMNSLVEQARTAASLPPLAQTLNGTVEVTADWNPSLHPRGPDGKFVKRPWNFDMGLEDINDAPTHRLVEFLGDTPGEPDMDAVLSDDGIQIDGIPDDVNTVDDLKSRINDPQSDMDVPTNPKDFGELGEGDVFRGPGGPLEVVQKRDDGSTLEVTNPEGDLKTYSLDEQSRSTVDVFDVDDMDDLPSQGGATPDGPPTLENVEPGDPRFSEPERAYKMEAEPGDLIQYEKTAPWGEEQEDMEPKVGELVSIAGTVMEVQPKDGDETIRFNTSDGGSHQPTGLLSVGGDDGDGFPSVDDLTGDNPDFVDDRNGADVGDFVRVDPKGLADRDDPFVGRVTERRFEGAEYTVETPDGDELDVGAGEPRRVEGYLPADPGGDADDFPDPSGPSGGRWATEGVLSPDEGDMVRFNSPRSMELEVGRVTDDGGMGPATVETADGETFSVSPQPDPDNGVYEFKGLFEPDEDTVSPSELRKVNERDTVDLTELDGTPAERREAVQGEFVGSIPEDHVTNEEIPEGVVIGKNRASEFLYEVQGYETDQLGDTELKIRSEAGRERTISARIANERYEYYEPGDSPTVSVPDDEWGDDSTPLAQRSRALKSVLDDVVPTADDSPDGNSDGNLDPESFDKAKEVVAKQLARSKDKEHAEFVMSRLTSIGEQGRAHAVIDQSVFGDTTAYFSVSNDEDADVIVHELGHSVGDIYDLKGGSNDMDGKTHPMPDFAWNSPKYDVPQKYGLKTPPWADDFEDDKAITEQASFNLDKWKDEVDAQVGAGLDGRNFSGVESPEDVPLQEGAMIQLAESPSYGDPKQWRISEVLDEQGGSSLSAVARVRLESRDGDEYEADLTESFGEARVDWGDDAPYVSGTGDTISGKRNGTPDNWREDPPDPDEWLGTAEYDDPTEAMRNLGDKVNKAWYRQAAASREHGSRDSSKYSILGGYSAKQAHETMSRVHHVMTPGGADTGRKVTNEKRAEAAMALVKYHPDLLAAYNEVYDIPVVMKQALNAVLEQEDAGFRFSDVPSGSIGGIESVEDAVQDIYAGGEA